MEKVSSIREIISAIKILGLLLTDIRDIANQKIYSNISEENNRILNKMREIIFDFRVSKNNEDDICLYVDRELFRPSLDELSEIIYHVKDKFNSSKIEILKNDINFEGPLRFKIIGDLAKNMLKFNFNN